MSLSLLLLTLTAYTGPVDNTNEGAVQACRQACFAFSDQPNFDLKGCVLKCEDFAKP